MSGLEEAPQTVADLVEQTGRDAAVLAAARNRPALVRATRRSVAVSLVVIAALTAFALANWAVVEALSTTWSGWRAPLAVSAVWLAVAVVLAVVVRPRQVAWSALTSEEEAEERFRTTLDELVEAVSRAAEQRIAQLILPVAGGMVSAGEGMIDATDEVIEKADEITDVLEERLPGGVVVNREVDVALLPGRFGIRIARTVFRFGPDSKA